MRHIVPKFIHLAVAQAKRCRQYVNYNGIVGLLSNIKAHKASGPDGISGTMLKRCAKVAAMFLKFIFEQSIATGDIPADWRNAIVHPVFKGGNSKQPENYRPISLTCICCKMMERILVSSITTYLEETNQLHHEFKYLGVIISNTSSWQKHVYYVASRSNQMLRFIKRNFKG